MSSYAPPTQNVSIFDEINFRSGETTLTQSAADKRYLRYPNAQGTENLQAINVSGIATFSNTITAPADLTLNPVGSITCNGKTVDMTGGEIHNCPLVHSQNNNNIIIEGKGTGDVIIKTNNINRLTIDDTGLQTFQGGATYNNATDTFTATTFSGSLNGTATNSTTLNVTSNNSNVTCYPIYIGSAAGTGKIVYADDTTGPFSFNPNTGAFNLASTIKVGPSTTGVVGIGSGAGQTTQSNNATAVGINAGASGQSSSAVAVGNAAGQTSQAASCVAVGVNAGNSNQGASAVAVGQQAGQTTQGASAVAIGQSAGNSNQGSGAIAIGVTTAQSTQGIDSVAIGNAAGQNTQGTGAVAVGFAAGLGSQGSKAIAIGYDAGRGSVAGQGAGSIAIGNQAQRNRATGTDCIAIGTNAGQGTTSALGNNTIAIGNGAISQRGGATDSIAIGSSAGLGITNGQGNNSIAIGALAQATNATIPGTNCIAIGTNAGQGTTSGQGSNAIAIGNSAASTNATAPGTNCIAIGTNAGQGTISGQGNNAIAIGNLAAQASQNANSICLNASGVALNPGVAGLFIDPVRNATQTTIVGYDTTSKELTYYSGVPTVAVTDTNTSATYYPTFVDAAGASQTLRADIGTTPFTYNPNTQILTAGIFSGYPSIPDVNTQATFTAGVLDGTGAGSARSFYGWWYAMTGTTNTITDITVTGAIANGYYYFVVTNNGSGNLTVNTMTKGSWAANLTIAAGKKVVFQCCMLRDGAASVSLYVNAFVFPI